MKHILLIGLFMLGCFQSKAQKTKETKGQIEVEAKIFVQQALWNEGRIEDFMTLYWKSDSLKFIGSKGVTYGWQKTLDNYKKAYPDRKAMGQLTFTIIENTRVGKDYIYVIGKWELEKDKPVGGHFTLLWKYIKGEWLIVADHTS